MGKCGRVYSPGRRAPGNVSTDEGLEPMIRILRLFILILFRGCSRLGLRGGEREWESHGRGMLASAKQ